VSDAYEPNLFFCGARRQGKSYAMRAMLAARRCSVFYDPSGEVEGVYVDRDPARLARRISRARVCDAVFWADRLQTPEEHGAALRTLYDAAEQNPNPVTVCVDELRVVVGRTTKPLERLMAAARMGAHPTRRVSLWIGSQRATDATPDWHSVMDRVLFFKQAGEANYSHVRREYGRDVEEAIRELEPYGFVEYDTLTGRWSVQRPLQ
jgi:hypothetical protein